MASPGSETWAFEHWGQPGSPAQTIVPFDFCGRQVNLNERAIPHFEALEDIFLAHPYGRSIDDIADDWGYNKRYIDGTTTWSNHSWGIALDLNATRNGQCSGCKGDIPLELVVKAEALGFRWGGRFSTSDPMHFESLLTPEEIADRFGGKGDWFDQASESDVRSVVRLITRDELERQLRYQRRLLAVGADVPYSPEAINLRALQERQ